MISGAASSCLGDLERFCLQVLSECRIHHAIGVIANWELHPQCVPLATRLDHTLAQVGLEFWVPEYYAESAAGAKVFISSQISGRKPYRLSTGGSEPLGQPDNSGNRVYTLDVPTALCLWTGHSAERGAASSADG